MTVFDTQFVLGKPDKYIKGEPCYTKDRCNKAVVKMILTGCYFSRIARTRTVDDFNKAADIIDEAQLRFDTSLCRLKKTESEITQTTKMVSENVRQATSKLGEGLARIEKQANFDRLERYVDLLERAEKALSALAILERDGKLEKIAQAIK